jgi:predicted transcriptional regulator
MRQIFLSEALQGRILQTLLETPTSTSQLAQYLRRRLALVRRELIHLHQLGVIRVIAVRSVDGDIPTQSYFQDYVWELTKHGMEHSDSRKGCRACNIRNHRLLCAGGLI